MQNRWVTTGKFAKREDSEQPSDDDDLHADQEDQLDILLCRMGLQEFQNLLGRAKEVDHPKWYARAGGYHGNSQSTLARRRRKMHETLDAVPMRTINSYFVNPHHHQEHSDDNTAPAAATASPYAAVMSLKAAEHERMNTCYKLIHELLNGSNSHFSCRSMMQYLTIQKCLRLQIDGMGKVESAERSSSSSPGNASQIMRCILNCWTSVFLETGQLPQSNQGKHRKSKSLLSDEDISVRIREWLLAAPKGSRNPEKLAHWVNNSFSFEVNGIGKAPISVRTVRNWMNTFGYEYGVY